MVRCADDSSVLALLESCVSSSRDEQTRMDRPSVPNSARARTQFADETMHVNGHGLTLGEVIGEGGMAVVHRGEQKSLRREVAIKTIVAPEERQNLLREAYVTAVLEHPNIVPIHELVFDPSGRPMLVLKRIEGESWYEQMRQDCRIEPDDGPDFIEWNIRIAIRVSRALSFAHTRGIAHLDVKPSNVMVGAFGEVYLLDWGLAGSFDPDEHFLPSVPDGHRAGTPGYMAPEQWRGAAAEMGPWTDVYLLAASLYHALSGSAPWTRVGKKREARTGKRTLPSALHAILERAMAPQPCDRIPSAASFRQELESYLRQRGSVQLADHAAELARDAVLQRGNGKLDAAEYSSVEAAATFSAALSQWPANEAAMRGQLRLARSRIDDALGRNLPDVAARILAAVADPPEDLRRKVEQAVALAEHHASEVRTLLHDQDHGVGMDVRIAVMALCGPLWIAGWIIGALTENLLTALMLLILGTLAWSAGLWALGRELLSNRLNRIVVFDIFCTLCAMIGLATNGYVRGDSLLSLAPAFLIVHACSTATVAVVFDMRLTILSAVWVLLIPLGIAWPSMGLWLIVLGNTTMVVGTLWVIVRVRQTAKAAVK